MKAATGPAYATLQDYLRLLRRQRWLILGVAAIFAVVAFAVSTSRDKTYTAQASLTFRDVTQDLTLLGNAGGVPALSPGERAAVNAEVITRPQVAEAVRRELETDIRASTLAGAVSTRVDTLSNLLLVDATWGTPAFAARIANGFAQQAVKASVRQQRRVIQRAIDVVKRRAQREGDLLRSPARDELVQLKAVQAISQPAAVVRKASAPGSANGPSTLRNTILGLIVGLAIGLLFAFIRDSLDRRLRGSGDVHDELDLPVLGRVSEDVLGHAAVAGNGSGTISEGDFEAFRVLRTNLQFLNQERDLRSILITSGLPEEGKSTTAMSLATAAAVAGRRTLLVECDLRRPSLAERTGLKQGPGLAQYLRGAASPQEILQVLKVSSPGNGGISNGAATASPELVCIAAGGPTADSAELLGSERFREFFEQVSTAYEMVVLDCSPLLSVVDPLELVPLVDGVIVCVRLSQSTRDEARATKAALDHLPERPTGVVVTGVRRGDDIGYGYYGYGYGA